MHLSCQRKCFWGCHFNGAHPRPTEHSVAWPIPFHVNAHPTQMALWPMNWTALPSGEMEVRVDSARLSYGATWSYVVLRSSMAVVRSDLQKLLFPSELPEPVAHLRHTQTYVKGDGVPFAGCRVGGATATVRRFLVVSLPAMGAIITGCVC